MWEVQQSLCYSRKLKPSIFLYSSGNGRLKVPFSIMCDLSKHIKDFYTFKTIFIKQSKKMSGGTCMYKAHLSTTWRAPLRRKLISDLHVDEIGNFYYCSVKLFIKLSSGLWPVLRHLKKKKRKRKEKKIGPLWTINQNNSLRGLFRVWQGGFNRKGAYCEFN